MFCERPRVLISIFRTFFRSSFESIVGGSKFYEALRGGEPQPVRSSGNLNFVKDFGDDFVSGDVVCFGFVCQADAVSENVVRHCDDILGYHISALMDEGIGFGGLSQRD